MSIKSKNFLLGPGEELPLSENAIVVASRFDEFVRASGLDPERVISDPLCSIPLPLYQKGEDGKVIRFKDVNASFMWHPVMWLPESSALRYQVRVSEEDDSLRIESDHEWVLRVALELRAAGLYNPHTGEWLDVLSLHGIDIDNPVDLARVEAWLAGAADEDLDAIYLSDIIAPEPENYWSLISAQELAQVFVPAQWHLTAASLLDALGDPNDTNLGPSDRLRLTRGLAELAVEMLSDVPATVGRAQSTEDQLLDVFDSLDETGIDIVAIGEELRSILTGIRDDYAIALETVRGGEE